MKKLTAIMAVAIAMTTLVSCSSQTDEQLPTQEEVSVKLDYAFFEQGSMSRSGEASYQAFYDEYIKTKQLAPSQYSLSFRSENKEYESVSGTWNETIYKLREGEYDVTGETYPAAYHSNSIPNKKYLGNYMFLSFDERIAITKETESVTLSAKYDCYLLLFSSDNITKITAYVDSYGTDINKVGNYYPIFVLANEESAAALKNLRLDVSKKDGTVIELNVGNMQFEKGKYYYFNEMSNSFDVPPMAAGN